MRQRVEIRPCKNCGAPWPMRHRTGQKWSEFCSIRCANLARGINPSSTRYRKREHRKVLESVLGRKLAPGECVHHKNGVKTDNRPENLVVMTIREHSKMHMTGNQNARSVAGGSSCVPNSRGSTLEGGLNA
jgi:hypothetical protein